MPLLDRILPGNLRERSCLNRSVALRTKSAAASETLRVGPGPKPRTDRSYASFDNLPAGRYKVSVLAPPAGRTASFDTPPGEPQLEDVTLSKGKYEYFPLTLGGAFSETRTLVAPILINDGSLGLNFSRRTLESVPCRTGALCNQSLGLVPGSSSPNRWEPWRSSRLRDSEGSQTGSPSTRK
jgi:hypothetical protein